MNAIYRFRGSRVKSHRDFDDLIVIIIVHAQSHCEAVTLHVLLDELEINHLLLNYLEKL